MNVRLLAIENWTGLLDVSAAGSDQESIVAITHPGWKLTAEDLQAAAVEFSNSSAELGILPVGDRGNLYWGGLPINLGLLAAKPGETAVVLLRDSASSVTGTDLWRTLVSTPGSSIQLFAGLDRPVELGPNLPLLAPGRTETPNWLSAEISRVCRSEDHVEGLALQAGVLQLHDELDRSHECSQQIEGRGKRRTGDYWHAIMHRREPDYGNSKYWFRRVGQHPLMAELGRYARSISTNSTNGELTRWADRICRNGWEPFAFVDLCEEASGDEDSALGLFARRIQLTEMHLLLKATAIDAGLSAA